jgi:peptide-methionine (S)-S-oxide reductase
MDLLIENGATPGDAHDALTHGNLEAAKHLVQITGRMTLTAAVCFDRTEDVKKMLSTATSDEKQVAMMAAAFYGKPGMLTLLLESGADVNGYIKSGFHNHASPLHQAVSSCSLDAVKLLVDAGANLNAIDKVYEGTPLDWAIYLRKEEIKETDRQKLEMIEEYLRHEGMKY